MFETNANGNRSYSNSSASKVANVAVAWRTQGHEPKAYAILDGDNGAAVKVIEVQITTARETAKALSATK